MRNLLFWLIFCLGFITLECNTWVFSQTVVLLCCLVVCFFPRVMINSSSITQQATELAEYTAKIALLEEARRRKESEVEEWQIRVSTCFRFNT